MPSTMEYKLFCNGFWGGFIENTDGVGVNFFLHILEKVLDAPVSTTVNITDANILLESHFGTSVLHTKTWKYSIFFSGEGRSPLPRNAEQYTFVMGSVISRKNFVSCPLYLAYEHSKPFDYTENITTVPEKNICSVISAKHREDDIRHVLIDKLEKKGVHIDKAGRYNNNVGFTVPGTYYEKPLLDFYKQYKFVLAFENTSGPFYITEKIINPMRAGVIPIYYGSTRINEYINSNRIIQITPATVDECIARVRHISENPEIYLNIVNEPMFAKSRERMVADVIEEMKIILDTAPYSVEIIANIEKERGRLPTLQPIIDYYHKAPVYEVWGDTVHAHPLYYKYAIAKHRIGAISLAINHISVLKKYAYKNKFLLMFESDVIPLHTVYSDMNQIHSEILKDMEVMREKNIDFVMLGKGCFDNVHVIPDVRPPVSPTLFVRNTSRCTESYIVSPEGIINFVDWFYKTMRHTMIDHAINAYFRDNPARTGCWRSPELFYQGSLSGLYPTSLPP